MMIIAYLIATLVVQVLIGSLIGAIILRFATHLWNRITGNQAGSSKPPAIPKSRSAPIPRKLSESPYQPPSEYQATVIAETGGLEIPRFEKAFVICLIANGINYLIGIGATLLINLYLNRLIGNIAMTLPIQAGRILIAMTILTLVIKGSYPTSLGRATAVAGLFAAVCLVAAMVLGLLVLPLALLR